MKTIFEDADFEAHYEMLASNLFAPVCDGDEFSPSWSALDRKVWTRHREILAERANVAETNESQKAALANAAEPLDRSPTILGSKFSQPGYENLAHVLSLAFSQAAVGKGASRHANGLPWTDQPIFTIARRHGAGFLTGQAEKKLGEAMGMLGRGQAGPAVHELLGAIVYVAAAVHKIQSENIGKL